MNVSKPCGPESGVGEALARGMPLKTFRHETEIAAPVSCACARNETFEAASRPRAKSRQIQDLTKMLYVISIPIRKSVRIKAVEFVKLRSTACGDHLHPYLVPYFSPYQHVSELE
jgi:hypothetical protein